MLHNNVFCLGIAVIYDALDFLIDLTGNLLTVSLGMCQILTDEDFTSKGIILKEDERRKSIS